MNNSSTPLPRLLNRYGTQAAVLHEFAPVAFYVYLIIPPVWYVIGLFGNPISAYIWLGHAIREGNSSAIYLGVLTVNDMIFLIIHFIYNLHFTWGQDFYVRPIGCEIFAFVFYIPQYNTLFLVFQFTFERFIAVCHPFLKYKLFTFKRTVNIIIFFIIISTLLSTVQIHMYSYDPSTRRCTVDSTNFKIKYRMFSEIVTAALIPLLVLVLNTLVLCRIYTISKNESSRRKTSQDSNQTVSTANLLGVSFYFLIAQFNLSIVGFVEIFFPRGDDALSNEEIRRDKTWSTFFTYTEIRRSIEALCLSYYASHFFIFCLTSNYFRLVLVYLFTRKGMLPYRDSILSEIRSSGIKMTMSTISRLKSENEEDECKVLEKRKHEQNTVLPTLDKHITQVYVTTSSTEV